ncbi:MAG: creatininase family protein [Halanaerobiales bacterium]|nr:creatininase family protein [Halanaerobiales bacterium]
MIAPSVNYGHVWTLAAFPGSVNISTEVLSKYIYEIGRSLIDLGFVNIVLLNGHGGNIPAFAIAGEMLADYGGQVITFNWWIDFRDEVLEFCDGQGHAGEDETSAALAVAEEYCDMSLAKRNMNKLIANIKRKDIGKISYEYGLSGDATKGTKEKGERMLDRVADRMMEILEQIWEGDIVG